MKPLFPPKQPELNPFQQSETHAKPITASTEIAGMMFQLTASQAMLLRKYAQQFEDVNIFGVTKTFEP